MPIVKLETVQQLTDHWKKAYPSSINDAFCREFDGKIKRASAFKISRKDIEKLMGSETVYLELHYGFEPASKVGEYAFKPIIVSLDRERKKLNAFEFEPVELYDANSEGVPIDILVDMLSHIPDHLKDTVKSHKRVGLDPDTESKEKISPVIEKWMFYNWCKCRSSELVDQFETLHNGERLRIEHSRFDQRVTSYFREKIKAGDFTIYLFLGLHQVVPGDPRIFHFAPILRTYGDVGVHASAAQSVDIELSSPCPPC